MLQPPGEAEARPTSTAVVAVTDEAPPRRRGCGLGDPGCVEDQTPGREPERRRRVP